MKSLNAYSRNGAFRHHPKMKTNRFIALKSTGQVSASAYTQESQQTCIACPCFQQFSRFVRTESYGHLHVTSCGHAFYQSTATTASEHLRSQVYHFVCNIIYISSGDSHCQFEECIACVYFRLVPTPSAQMRIWFRNGPDQQIGVFRRPHMKWDVRSGNFDELFGRKSLFVHGSNSSRHFPRKSGFGNPSGWDL